LSAPAKAKLPGSDKAGNRKPRGPNRLSQSIKDAIEGAFRAAGGQDYLLRVARKRPDVFLGLLGKIIPAETRTTILAAYEAMPMRVVVEDRPDAIPALGASPAVLEAFPVGVETQPARPAKTVPVPSETDADF